MGLDLEKPKGEKRSSTCSVPKCTEENGFQIRIIATRLDDGATVGSRAQRVCKTHVESAYADLEKALPN